MRQCIEEGCLADISHKGNRAKRCDTHQKAFAAAAERSRYGRVKDAISTHRILRRQSAAEYEGPRDDDLVVDYRVADQRPSFVRSGRTSPRHDTARRVAMDMAEWGGGLEPSMMTSWSQLQDARTAGAARVPFPAPDMGHAGNPFYGRRSSGYEGQPIDNPAALGARYVPSPRAGRQALQANQAKRFGPQVPDPVQVTSGMLASPLPDMVQAEVQVAEQQRQADEHTRSQVPSWRH